MQGLLNSSSFTDRRPERAVLYLMEFHENAPAAATKDVEGVRSGESCEHQPGPRAPDLLAVPESLFFLLPCWGSLIVLAQSSHSACYCAVASPPIAPCRPCNEVHILTTILLIQPPNASLVEG